MPVTYKGAIKKKTRRRRLLPKIFRQEIDHDELSLFEYLSIDEIKKVRTAVAQKQAVQKMTSENKNLYQESKKRRVKFQLKPDKYEKSPAFCPGSPNSTFDNLLKRTPLQPLNAVNCNTNSGVSNVSSSGNSLQLGSVHRYFTRRQALLGNLSSHSESSNLEWSLLHQSHKNASPDLIPNTPLTTFTKPKKHQFSKRQNVTNSFVISRNKGLNQLPIVVSVAKAQVTSTPVECHVLETDLFSVSPLSSIKGSEFADSVMRECTLKEGSEGASEEEKLSSAVEDILTSSQSTENMPDSRNRNLREMRNNTSVEENFNSTEQNAKTLHQRMNRLNTVKNPGPVENVLFQDKILNYVGVEKCFHKSQGSLLSGDVMIPNYCSTHKNSVEGTVQEHEQNVCETSSINCCIDKHFSSVSLKNLGETVKGDIVETGDLSIHSLTNECLSSAWTRKCYGTVVEEGLCNNVSTGLSSNSPSPIPCNSYAHEYIHTVCEHPSSSRISKESEVEADITDTLMLTCSDVTAELSLLEESLSLSQPEHKSNPPTTSESLPCLASSNTSCRSDTMGETSLSDGVQHGRCTPTCPSLTYSVQHLVVEGMSNVLSDACVPSLSSGLVGGLVGSCNMNSLVPAQGTLGVCSPVEDLQCQLSSGYRRKFPELKNSDSRLSGQCTPKQRCYRQSYSVVVRDVEPSLSSHHSSGFRNVYSSRLSETAENYQRLSSSELGVVSVSPAVSEHRRLSSQQVTARELVLQKCGQQAPIPFSKAFSRACLNNCKKIGEGVYGEVFLCENGYRGTKSVLKIIPIEGEQEVNCAAQKKFEEILSEIVIAMELSSLRNCVMNTTSAFSEVLRCLCVQGRYPKRLIELWNKFAAEKTTENDNPEMFDRHQLFIILELSHAGIDLEAYVFLSAHQALSVFQQITCGLAVAEVELEFEHRDLHWGNVLVTQTLDQTVSFKINGSEIEVETKGVKATIIDFTLSRMTFDGCQIFNDLSLDPDLFVPLEQCSDYQFKIYTLMRIAVQNDWKRFEPKTNIHWLHYLADKLIRMARYLQTRTKVHLEAKMKLQYLFDCCLLYSSASEFIDNCLEL